MVAWGRMVREHVAGGEMEQSDFALF